jgi:hypothetical protein
MRAMIIKQGVTVTTCVSPCPALPCPALACPSLAEHLLTSCAAWRGVSSAGKGELNAALSGLGQLTGIIFPMAWGAAFKFFNEMDASYSPAFLRWGPGGHFFISGLMFLLANVILQLTPRDKLFIDEGDTNPDGSPKTKS